MSPKVSAVLELVAELSEQERKHVRVQRELDEGTAALGRKLPNIAPAQRKAIEEELERRLANPGGPGVPIDVAIRRARKTLATLRKQRQNPKKK